MQVEIERRVRRHFAPIGNQRMNRRRSNPPISTATGPKVDIAEHAAIQLRVMFVLGYAPCLLTIESWKRGREQVTDSVLVFALDVRNSCIHL